jgi:hypothetical protein
VKLQILSGYRELLLPRQVGAGPLLRALRAFDPRARLPIVRWADEPRHYHDFLEGKDTDLFLEYLEDLAGADETLYVVFPAPEERVAVLVAAAQERFGETAVRCRRLYLSDATQAVLRRLQPGAPRDIAATDWPVNLEEMRANYTRAVLRLAAPQVFKSSVLFGDDRADRVADLLEANDLLLRTDASPDRVLAALVPGGELHELLTRPLPGPGGSSGSMAHEGLVTRRDQAGSSR